MKNRNREPDTNQVHRASRRVFGTTLVELLVACAFLGICSTAILSSIGTATKSGDRSQDRLIALAVAEQEIDRQRSAALAGALTPKTVSSVRADTGIKRTVTISTTVTAADATNKLFRVQVRVSWNPDPLSLLAKDTDVALETYVRAPEG